MKKQPKATVLGGAGYIGQHLATYLNQHGWMCATPTREDESIFKADLGIAFYCVGLTADFRSRPLDTVQAHVGLLQRLISEARFDKLIYLSSTRVYLGADDTHEDQSLRVLPGDPDDLYKLSKLMGESLTLHGGRPGVVVRLSNVVGGLVGNPDSFVYSLLREARQGHITLRSDPQTAKDYIHIDDVVGLLQCLARNSRYQTYNVASGVQLTHTEWLQRIAQITGCEYSFSHGSASPVYLPIRVDRICSEFGFRPKAALDAVSTLISPPRPNKRS